MAERRVVTVAVAAAVGALAGVGAVAGADFVDSANSPFATEIENIADAGCASGFAGNQFRPRDGVTRQQFAAWMNRCGGRVEAADSGTVSLTTDAEADLVTATLHPGAIPGGGGFVLVSAALEATGGDVTYRLRAGAGSPFEVVTLSAGTEGSAGGAMTEALPVDGGSAAAFTLSAQRAPGVPVDVDASLTLLYVPFAGDGTGGGIE